MKIFRGIVFMLSFTLGACASAGNSLGSSGSSPTGPSSISFAGTHLQNAHSQVVETLTGAGFELDRDSAITSRFHGAVAGHKALILAEYADGRLASLSIIVKDATEATYFDFVQMLRQQYGEPTDPFSPAYRRGMAEGGVRMTHWVVPDPAVAPEWGYGMLLNLDDFQYVFVGLAARGGMVSVEYRHPAWVAEQKRRKLEQSKVFR